MNIEKEIEALKNKLAGIGNKKHEDKTNVDMNLDVIQESIDEKTEYLNRTYYYKSSFVSEPPEVKILSELQAIHNLFIIFNERIDKLEKTINKND